MEEENRREKEKKRMLFKLNVFKNMAQVEPGLIRKRRMEKKLFWVHAQRKIANKTPIPFFEEKTPIPKVQIIYFLMVFG